MRFEVSPCANPPFVLSTRKSNFRSRIVQFNKLCTSLQSTNCSGDNLVWPDEKDVATDTAFDGWAGNTDGTDLDVLLDYSYSYEY